MDTQIRIIVLLGIVEVIILTMIGLYFFRFTGDTSAEQAPGRPDPVAEEVRQPKQCARGGCSGQLCVEASMADQIVSTCEYREEYGCYRVASCEAQSDGKCGFTETEELATCLEKARQAPRAFEPMK